MNNRTLDNWIDEKVIAGSVAAYLATLIGGFITAQLGLELDTTALQTVLLPLVVAVPTAAVAYLKRSSRVEALIDFYRRNGQEPAEPDEPTD